MSMKDEERLKKSNRRLNAELVAGLTFKVEKDIPIPPPGKGGKGRGGSDCKYPWPEMEVGDSVWLPLLSPKSFASLINSSRSWFIRNKPHLKVVTRIEYKGKGKNEQKGVRVWVVEIERDTAI